MSNSNTPGNFPDSTPTRDTPSDMGETPAQLQTPLPNSAFQTPAFGDILSPGDRFTPLPNTVGSGRQYVVPPMRGHTSTSAQSSPLYYPGSQNAPVAPRVSNTSVAGPESFEAEEVRTQRRNFHRGDINSTILTPGFEPLSPGVGLTPFTPGGLARSQDGTTPFQLGTPGPFATAEQSQTDTTQVIWGTTVNIHKAMSDFYKFLTSFSLDDLPEALRDSNHMADGPYYTKLMEELSQTQQLNLNLDCSHLLAFPETQSLYHQLKRYPQEIIPLMDHTLTTLYFERFGIQDHLTQPLRVRPFNLVESVNMRELNPSDIDQLVTIKGLLIRASHVLPDLKSAFFKCYMCDHTVTVGIDRGVVAEPTACPRPDCQTANSMQLIHNRSMFADKQVCKLQETPDNIPDGQTPHSVSLCLYDDLVDASKPGDRLEVTGIFRSVPIRINPRMRTIKSLFRTYVDVVHIKTISASRIGGVSVEEGSDPLQDPSQRLSPEQEDEIRALSTSTDIYEKLSYSLAPSIFGLDDVKKGVLLQLFGGSTRTSKSSSSQGTRGDLHILLVGDPGTSKSQLLHYAHRIAPRGMYTSGKGSSAVGLTAYITRDPDTNQLVLESGALVLSDGGLCCIDEFDKMSDSTRSILHEVMEQQTVSIAKAGIITTLNARTSILACANPVESQWQRNLSVPENINLPPSLLSRFDLVYLMLDTANEDQDRRLARHLVKLYLNPNGRDNENIASIPTHLLTRYIAYAKARINPVLNDEASRELVRMYVELRKAGESTRRQESRITATTRQLESLIRLSEAHARMRLSPVVEKPDVEEAFRLLREAIKESATDPRTGLIDWDILATGLGNHSRRQLLNLKMGLVELLGQPASSANIPATQLLAELNRRASSSGVSEVTYKDLETILKELENEQLVSLSGNGRNNRKVRRNFHQGYVLPQQN